MAKETKTSKFMNYHHFKKILYLSLPTVLSAILTFFVEIVNVAFIGNLNDSYMLSGVGLGNMMINAFWVSVYMGINGALETLVSQAYGGRNWYICGDVLNRGWIVISLLFIPVSILLFTIEDILMALHVDALTASYAKVYSRWLLVGLFAQALFDLFRKFMIMMGEPVIPMIIQGVTMPLHILFCYILVNQYGMQIEGVAIATNITFCLNFIIVFIACFYIKQTKQCIHEVERGTFAKLWSYFILGVPTAMMTCLDIWAFSMLTLIAHYLGVDENAGQVILLNVLSILYSIPMGFASGSCALVGRNIGKGKVQNSKMYAKQALFLVMMVSLIPCLCFSLFPRGIVEIFTSDQNVIEACYYTMLLSSIGFQADAMQGQMQGVVKGVGQQNKAWYGNTLNYIIGLPLAYLCAFVLDMKLLGLWIGMYTAQAFVFIYFATLLKFTNWELQVAKAQIRINEESKQSEGRLLVEEKI